MSEIHSALISVMREVEPITKEYLAQVRFSARTIETIVNMLHPLFVKHGIVMLSEAISERYEYSESKSGTVMTTCYLRCAYHFTAADGSQATVVVDGEARDASDKATAKAHTMAKKVALIDMFLIHGAEDEPDAEKPEAEKPRGRSGTPKRDSKADPQEWAWAQLLDLTAGDKDAATRVWWDLRDAMGVAEDARITQAEAVKLLSQAQSRIDQTEQNERTPDE